MKKRNLLATLLALLMIVSFSTVSANASTTPSSNPLLALSVSVDNVIVPYVTAYQGIDGNIRVYSYDELRRIFPSELENELGVYVPEEGIILDKYISWFGYTAEVINNATLNIYTKNAPSHLILPSGPPVLPQTFEVYYNGVYVNTLNNDQIQQLGVSGKTVYSGNRLYINNDNNLPVEIYADGTLVHFPDQQPIVMAPGRTMIPIRAIAELFPGCVVDWDNNLKCAVITRNSTTMAIFPGSNRYLLDGKYYDMDITPVILNGRTMVPVRFIAEAFSFKVGFNSGDVLTVTLDS